MGNGEKLELNAVVARCVVPQQQQQQQQVKLLLEVSLPRDGGISSLDLFKFIELSSSGLRSRGAGI